MIKFASELIYNILLILKRLFYILLFSCIFSCINAQKFHLYELRNSRGMSMDVTDYGARIVSLRVPDKEGKIEDIVCGFDSLEQYAQYKQNYGAVVGRYIGRILGAEFSLDGKQYKLDAEANGHCSHGGKPGFANRVWKRVKNKSQQKKDESSITLQYVSPDGESGFPGKLTLWVTYTLTNDNELKIEYEAKTNKPTVLNPSNHSFINLSGNFNQTVLKQVMQIDGDSIALYDDKKCVTGQLMAVDNSPFDFRSPTNIGLRIDADNPQLKVTNGYDHTYRLNHQGDINHVAASIYDPESGRLMEVLTTEPALHIYAGNGLKANTPGKNGIKYAKRTAICFETMHFADSPNKPQWPSTVLRPGKTFKSTTIFRFSTHREINVSPNPSNLSNLPTPSNLPNPSTLQTTNQYIPVAEGGKLFCQTYGKGEPLILIHGHSLDRRMWRKQIEAFTPYYNVITFDVRGYGRSSKLNEGLKTTHVDDLITLMDSLKIEKAHVVGLSMGGFIAADMLAMYPERMLSCVMASGSLRSKKGPNEPDDAEEIAAIDKKIEEVKAKGVEQTRNEWIEQLIKGGGSQAENMRDELTTIIKDWDCWSLTHREPHLWYAREAAPRLKERCPEVPTLFLSGDKENKKRSSMMKSLPNSDFIVIPDCGHMSNMERPDEFNKIILDFLKSKL